MGWTKAGSRLGNEGCHRWRDYDFSLLGTYIQEVGSLLVILFPQGAIDAVGTVATRGNHDMVQQLVHGESSIPVGAYTVEFKDVTGWTTPSSAGW